MKGRLWSILKINQSGTGLLVFDNVCFHSSSPYWNQNTPERLRISMALEFGVLEVEPQSQCMGQFEFDSRIAAAFFRVAASSNARSAGRTV